MHAHTRTHHNATPQNTALHAHTHTHTHTHTHLHTLTQAYNSRCMRRTCIIKIIRNLFCKLQFLNIHILFYYFALVLRARVVTMLAPSHETHHNTTHRTG